MKPLLLHNIGLLATPQGFAARCGSAQGEILKVKNAWLKTDDRGVITEIGQGDCPEVQPGEYYVLDADGRLVTPGLIDAHTHLIFGGWRQNEFGLKLHGATYLEILAAGGGILSTVRSTRAASAEELKEQASGALHEMITYGVTTCEAKSGYGLDRETELKQLRVIRELNREWPIELVPTYLGAHAVPEEFKEDRNAYIRLLTEVWLPEIAREGLAEFCDVFCEKGVFTAEESRRILEAGLANGLLPKIHADEIEAIGGTELTADLKAVSAEHLIVCQDSGIEAMAKGGTVACLLPMTSFYLGATYAPARKMIDAGVPVAVASDFNPGSCPGLNLQLAMTVACLKYRLTPEEILTAVTLNAAAAIRRADRLGSIEPGKQADLVIWKTDDLDYIPYRLGSNLAKVVIKKGEIIRVN
ncbi:MAG: imidazolonepropionase [Lachnospiraceae bacterium]|nr:imidazolonepropionase [Lachnospiraceae bacterium]